MTAYIVAVALFLLVLFMVYTRSNWQRELGKLKQNMDFSLKSSPIIKVEMVSNKALNELAVRFNKLVAMLKGLEESSQSLKMGMQEKESLSHKISEAEQMVYQLSAITEVGRQITSGLDIQEMLQTAYKFVSSSMEIDSMDLHGMLEDGRIDLSVSRSTGIQSLNSPEWSDQTEWMQWCMDNGKEMLLNDAPHDYQQYVFNPVGNFQGKPVGSLLALPLMSNEQVLGVTAVYSAETQAFNDYQVRLMQSIASYMAVAIANARIYQQLEVQKREVESEKAKSDALLLNILPSEVATELKQHGFAKAKQFENVTVLFTDFVNFTGISGTLSPKALVEEINAYFIGFDEIITRHGVEKIKTIGDAYMAVCGLPTESENHAEKMVKVALDILDFVNKRKQEGGLFDVRIGLNSGSVVAGIIGFRKYAYDIWGDTVNTAARMESSSDKGRINISGVTHELLQGKYNCTYRGKIEAKNKGEIDMYYVEP